MERYFCDRCHREILTDKNGVLPPHSSFTLTIKTDEGRETEMTALLCSRCMEKLRLFMEAKESPMFPEGVNTL